MRGQIGSWGSLQWSLSWNLTHWYWTENPISTTKKIVMSTEMVACATNHTDFSLVSVQDCDTCIPLSSDVRVMVRIFRSIEPLRIMAAPMPKVLAPAMMTRASTANAYALNPPIEKSNPHPAPTSNSTILVAGRAFPVVGSVFINTRTFPNPTTDPVA